MSRLIEADVLLDLLSEQYKINKYEKRNDYFNVGLDQAKNIINSMPTAFDKEKVIQEIKDTIRHSKNGLSMDDIYEIIQKGGVE